MLCHSFIRGTFVDGLTKTQKNHALDGVGNFRLGIAVDKPLGRFHSRVGV
jgi:hypothetical protein